MRDTPSDAPRYEQSAGFAADMENRFRYHQPHAPHQGLRYEAIRALLLKAAKSVSCMCPPSRELSLALTKLEEAMFWANASIARNERPNHAEAAQVAAERPQGA